MESVGETCELQQLVPSDPEGENDEGTAQDDYNINDGKVISPIRSVKVSSSGATSHSSVSKKETWEQALQIESKLFYINEKNRVKTTLKVVRYDLEMLTKSTSTCTPIDSGNTTARHHCFLSEVPDVRHMEQALLGLLADFHSGKLKAFGSGSTMEQMTNIREQQEKLAKLHFDLGTANDPSLSEEGLRHSHNTMTQLIERLEQLSVSIEGLHNDNDK